MSKATIIAGADINAGDGGYRIGNEADYKEFVAKRNESLALAKDIGVKFHHYTNTDDPVDFPKNKIKYWTIVFPGEFGQHVQETWTDDQILSHYLKFWSMRMIEAGKGDQISKELCLDDWKTVHWAVETDEFGNKL
jgi:hypothetical protein